MASGTQGYTKTFSGDFTSYVVGKVKTAAQNAKQEKENQKKAEELGIEVPEEEKKGLFKRALGYEFGGRRFDRSAGPFIKKMSAEQSSSKSKFSDQFSYTKALKKEGKKKKSSPLTTTGKTTTKKGGGGGRKGFVNAFGEITLQLEQINNRVASLVSLSNNQVGATYKVSGGLAGIQQILREQTNLQRDANDDAEIARKESTLEQGKISSGSEAAARTYDNTPGSDEFDNITPGGGAPGVPDGGGGEQGGGPGILDAIDAADDVADLAKGAKAIGKRGLGRVATRGAAKLGGKGAAKLVGKAGSFGSKLFGKGAGLVGKGLGKVAGKGLAKGVAKGVGKSLIKKIPLLGAVAGLGFGIQRAMQGDWLGATGEVASGVASTLPGLGTAASVGIDAALMGRDMMTPEKTAEGGVMPLASRFAAGMLPGIGPMLSAGMAANDIKNAQGKGKGMGMNEVSALPMKAIGGSILAVTSGFIEALGPIGAVVAPVIKQAVSPLARAFGMPATLVKFGKIGGAKLRQKPGAEKSGKEFFKDFMNNALEKMGIKKKDDKKKTTPSSTGTGGGGGNGGAGGGDAGGDAGAGGGSGADPSAAPGTRPMTGDEFAAKTIKDTKLQKTQGARGSTKLTVGAGSNLAPVHDAEEGRKTDYYHDMFGQVYKIDQEKQKLLRVTQKELENGVPQEGAKGLLFSNKLFFRKPDKNVVVANTFSAPVDSIELSSKKIVKLGGRGQGKYLSEPTADDKKRLGIDSIKSPFGAPTVAAPQIQAASGISITSNGGSNKQLSPGKTFGFKDLNPHHSDEGRNRTYAGMKIGVPKDYGMGVLPNYMPSGPNGKVPLPVAGKVLLKEWDKTSGYGRTVLVETSLGKMQFSHLSKFGSFNQGDQLSAGTIIGVQGGSGDSGNNSYAEHLHLNATKQGHEAFVNFITSGKPTTGSVAETDDPGNENNGAGQAEPKDPVQAFTENLTNLQNAVKAYGESWTTWATQPDTPLAPPTPGTPAAAATPANTKPGATTPAAAAPARPSASPAAAAQPAARAAGNRGKIAAIPAAPPAPGGAGSFQALAFDRGTARDLTPQLVSYLG